MSQFYINPDNFKVQIHRPFGPYIGQCRLPEELIDDFNKDCESIMDNKAKKKTHDHSKALVGNVKQELIISEAVFDKWVPYFSKLMSTYVSTHSKEIISQTKLSFLSRWYVRSFSGDFNPAHYHTDCHISCAGYLKLPEGIEEEWEQEDKLCKEGQKSATSGKIEMQFGQFQQFSNNIVRMRPKVGDYYIFPWWMYHMVYPFRTKGERRSFAFNVRLDRQ